MDSMRHLSTSLPGASSRQSQSHASNILADFKAAALSITNLYKTAASSQALARSAGYQDALDDLLAFLDKENLGLMDGEGWKVRQWATERLDSDGMTNRQGASGASGSLTDDEEEVVQMQQDGREEERSSSPELQRKSPPPRLSEPAEIDAAQHRRVVSETSVAPQTQTSTEHVVPTSDFTFSSTHSYPTNHDRTAVMEVDRATSRHSRPGRHHRRNTENRTTSLNFNLGSGSGSKRKIPYPDFFDISGSHDNFDRKDGSGSGRGGKRGRHV